VQKNVHHAIFVLDLANRDDLDRLVQEIASLIKRQLPIRFGIVLVSPEGDTTSEHLTKVFYHLVDTYGRATAMAFAERLLEKFNLDVLSTQTKSHFTSIAAKAAVLPGHEKLTFDELVSRPCTTLDNNRRWANRLGLPLKQGAILGNGLLFVKDDNWVNKVGSQFHRDITLLQQAVYQGDISDDDDILEYLFRDAPKHRNEYIFPAETSAIGMVNLAQRLPADGIVYVHGQPGPTENFDNSTAIWIVDDFDAGNGVQLVRSAAAFQSSHPHVTIGLVHNPGPATGPPNLSLLLYYLGKQGLLDDSASVERFHQLVKEVDLKSQAELDETAKLLGIKAQSWRAVDLEESRQFWENTKSFVQAAGYEPGQRGLVINGRV
jgi:UDP-glucose:glycoprotein glucosyltransferase